MAHIPYKTILSSSYAFQWNYNLRQIRAIRFVNEITDQASNVPESFHSSELKYIKSCKKINLLILGSRKSKLIQRILRHTSKFNKTIQHAQYSLNRAKCYQLDIFSQIKSYKLVLEDYVSVTNWNNPSLPIKTISKEDFKLIKRIFTSPLATKITIDCISEQTISQISQLNSLKYLILRSSLHQFAHYQGFIEEKLEKRLQRGLSLSLKLTDMNFQQNQGTETEEGGGGVNEEANEYIVLQENQLVNQSIQNIVINAYGQARDQKILTKCDLLINLESFNFYNYAIYDNDDSKNSLVALQDLKSLKHVELYFNMSSLTTNFASLFSKLTLPPTLTSLILDFHNINPNKIDSPLTELSNLEKLQEYSLLTKFGLKLNLSLIVKQNVEISYLLAIQKVLQHLNKGIKWLIIDLPNFSLDQQMIEDNELSKIPQLITSFQDLEVLDLRLPIDFTLKTNSLDLFKKKSDLNSVNDQSVDLPNMSNYLHKLKILNIKESLNFDLSLFKRVFRSISELSFIPGKNMRALEITNLIRSLRALNNLRKLEIISCLSSRILQDNSLFDGVYDVINSLKLLNIVHISISNITIQNNQAVDIVNLIRWKRSLRAAWIKMGSYSFHRGPYDMSGLFCF